MSALTRLRELAARLPANLRADWKDTRHYELLCSGWAEPYQWFAPGDIQAAQSGGECGRKLGLLLDLAEELSRPEVRAALEAADGD